MEKVILLLGDFTFFDLELDGKLETIINRVDKVMLVDDDRAGEIGEEQLEEGCESYLVPRHYFENPEASISWESIIDEDTHIVFDKYEQLTYANLLDNIMLFIDGYQVGRMKVWCDSEMDNREYITVNHTIVYLDTLTKQR